MLSYQGYLTNTVGDPITDTLPMTFAIFDAEEEGNVLWSESQDVGVEDGVFAALLGNSNHIPDSVFTQGTDRWLEQVVSGETMSPRARIASVAYAYTSTFSDTAEYAYDGPGVTDNDWIESSDVLYTGDFWGVARGNAGNATIGDSAETHVNLGTACTTGTAGQNYYFITISGGQNNIANERGSTIGGGRYNNATSLYATVGGGYVNTADRYATVGGGWANEAQEDYSTIGGGRSNTVSASYSTVCGGYLNETSGQTSVIAGGYLNDAIGKKTFVGGGQSNIAAEEFATISGGAVNSANAVYATICGGYTGTVNAPYGGISSGEGNMAGDSDSDTAAVVAGGQGNMAIGRLSFIGGGKENVASNTGAVIGGGIYNEASHRRATVAGGESNRATNVWSTIGGGSLNYCGERAGTVGGGYADSVRGAGCYGGILSGYSNQVWDTAGAVVGGWDNEAEGKFSFIGGGKENTTGGAYSGISGGKSNVTGDTYSNVSGGLANTANGYVSTVGGGRSNTASGSYSAIPGGYANEATGSYSFAAGFRAKASHDGSFVWADGDLASFESTAENQFLIEADGGVGIGTNSPQEALDVAGNIQCDDIQCDTAACDILVIAGGYDLAESFDVSDPNPIEPGMVLAIDVGSPGKLKVADRAYDHCVAGVVCGAGDIQPGLMMGTVSDGDYPVALTGRVYCYADASSGSIKPGDLLTTSDTPGHAMKATDSDRANGAVLGKAMTLLDEGTGLVLVLVNLQ
jgi:hypothetical protein